MLTSFNVIEKSFRIIELQRIMKNKTADEVNLLKWLKKIDDVTSHEPYQSTSYEPSSSSPPCDKVALLGTSHNGLFELVQVTFK